MTPQQVETLAQQILRDPVLMAKLCDRIYRLLKTDRRLQQERTGRPL
ncbi:hypothetical protein IQ260_19210 [Leptolyngbya cf. ectocarpi LEGE 11479]|uniref:Uncharacterized protein n=1 Tax=Leptolyngbya cf. ectocarpi LEGE 11479 TaxID=1828722 RepID=A0A928ZWH4_LEPEC|nr:hypothetical protein [Leptolyngbya ectocarpi]MBE9068777.1 hypothetical protein [Leptolyngbya cf. ectocarpi LEGE 11479]